MKRVIKLPIHLSLLFLGVANVSQRCGVDVSVLLTIKRITRDFAMQTHHKGKERCVERSGCS